MKTNTKKMAVVSVVVMGMGYMASSFGIPPVPPPGPGPDYKVYDFFEANTTGQPMRFTMAHHDTQHHPCHAAHKMGAFDTGNAQQKFNHVTCYHNEKEGTFEFDNAQGQTAFVSVAGCFNGPTKQSNGVFKTTTSHQNHKCYVTFTPVS